MRKRAKPIFANKSHPFWGKCDICEQEDVLIVKGGNEGLCLVCSICDEEILQTCVRPHIHNDHRYYNE